MPLTVLASVSLLALVVTGRPILDPDPRLCVPSVRRWFTNVLISLFSIEATGEVHNAVQAIIESRLGYVQLDPPPFPMIVAAVTTSSLPLFNWH